MNTSLLFRLILAACLTLFSIESAFAVSQFSRKFETGCSTCHSSFPRLNYFGEQFMRNGYQMPGMQDGDEKKTAVNERLMIDKLQHLLGLRVSVTAIEIKQNALAIDGEMKTAVNFGQSNWLQLFTAGSLYKNTSIFIESELDTANSKVKNSWFRLGFHNLFGPQGAANLRVGKTSPMEWHAISGRLRMVSPVKVQVISNYKTSGGYNSSTMTSEDEVPLATAMPGISFYGNRGPLLYSVGVTNGANLSDKNDEKNWFGTLRYDIQSGAYRGSAVSIWAMTGTDSINSGTETMPVAQTTNDFQRSSVAANVRRGDLDVIMGYFIGEDDNWSLGLVPDKNEFDGLIVQIGYNFSPPIYAALQYDKVNSDDDNDDAEMLTLSGWYLPRENMRLGLIGRINCDGHVKNQLSVALRSMF